VALRWLITTELVHLFVSCVCSMARSTMTLRHASCHSHSAWTLLVARQSPWNRWRHTPPIPA